MPLEAHPLQGQVALVTGAARGIGAAVAVELAAQGAAVVAFDKLDSTETVSTIVCAGGASRMMVGSVADEAQVLHLFSSIEERERRLNIVVNCAGIQVIRPLIASTLADFDGVMNVNLKGTFLVGREAAKWMLRSFPGGRIINIASELGYLGRANYSLYCATKGAVLALTRSWARELAPHIRVNAVAPGPTDTAMVSSQSLSAHEIQQEIDTVPLGRLARPDEIAATVAFLAGPGGSYFTGQCVSPNGGAAMF